MGRQSEIDFSHIIAHDSLNTNDEDYSYVGGDGPALKEYAKPHVTLAKPRKSRVPPDR